MPEMSIIVEMHEDGYVAYASSLRGIVVGEGDCFDEAVADLKSAIRFHVETFGRGRRGDGSSVIVVEPKP